MTAQPADVSTQPVLRGPFSTRERVVLTFASVLCGVLLVWISRLSGTPSEPGFAGSILRDRSGIFGLVGLGASLVACTVLASAFVGRVRYEAGLFCSCIGLAMVSIRAGGVRPVLQDAGGASVFMTLAIESAVLFAFLAGAAYVIHLLSRRGLVSVDSVLETDKDVTLVNKILATVTSAGLIVVLTSLLAQSDDKGQVLASVLVASLVGVIGGHALFPTRGSVWFWTAPLLASIFGYAHAAYTATPSVYLTGLAPTNLSRALPLDFASVGCAGAIFGYWTARRWKHAVEEDES